ncbi:MAG: protein kinase, partial [Bryobacterales bacterium]|nr:protein kinase [Bryobacterales bacterium]
MNAQGWEKAKALFEQLAELPPADAEARLAEEPDPVVRAEVAALLQFQAQAESGEGLLGALEAKVTPYRAAFRQQEPARTFQPGELAAGRFRIVRFIAEGGMGEVYEARDEQLQEAVAVKTLRVGTEADLASLERFKQEIQLARKVSHPNVCRVHDLWQHAGGVHFLTMELLLPGETLAARIRRLGKLSPEEALPIAMQLAAGLDAAHAAGIVHRDFKPANVILTPRRGSDAGERAVITDFGLSRVYEADGQTASVALIGTPAYMAPEQIDGSAPSGPAVDIYALGVVLYEMITGALPFSSASPMALAVKKVRDTPRPPSHTAASVAPAWDATILRCLMHRPADRFANAAAVVEGLTGARRVRTVRLPRWAPAAAVAALVLLTAGLAYRWGISGDPELLPEARRWYEQGVAALYDQAPAKARDMLDKAVSIDSRYPLAHARLAQALMELDQYDAARDRLLRAASLTPDRSRLSRRTRLQLDGVEKVVLRDFDTAVSTFGELVAETDGDTGALFDLARAQRDAGKPGASLETARRITKTDPTSAGGHLMAANLLDLAGQRPEAMKEVDEAAELFKMLRNFEGIASARLQRMWILRNLRKAEENEAEAREALQFMQTAGLQYQETQAWIEIARSRRVQAKFNESRDAAVKAIELAQTQGHALLEVFGRNDLAGVYFAQSHMKEAEQAYRDSLRVAERAGLRLPKAMTETALARTLIIQSRPGEAVPLLQHAEAFLRENRYRNELAELNAVRFNMEFDGNRNFVKARQIADAFLTEIKDWDAPEAKVLAIRRAGAVAVTEGDFPRAVELAHLVRAQASSQGNNKDLVTSLMNETRLHLVMGDAATAERLLAEATQRAATINDDGTRASLALYQVEVAILKQRWAEARTRLEAARELAARVKPLLLAIADQQVSRGEKHVNTNPAAIRELIDSGVPLAMCEAARAISA